MRRSRVPECAAVDRESIRSSRRREPIHGRPHAVGRCATRLKSKGVHIAKLRVNDEIRAFEVRVVAPDGAQIGVKTLREAKWLADQLGLDLVEVAPQAKPPVARLMDYGKYKYEQSVKEREARKKQTRSTVKELSFRVKISDHDYRIKANRARKFLDHGDRVRVRVWLRGREATRPQLGLAILDRLKEDLGRGRERGAGCQDRGQEHDHGLRAAPENGPASDGRQSPLGRRDRGHTMPKMKTHKGTAKRVKVTGKGRLRRRQSHRGHLRLAKGKDSYRRLKGETDLSKGDAKRVKRLLGM